MVENMCVQLTLIEVEKQWPQAQMKDAFKYMMLKDLYK